MFPHEINNSAHTVRIQDLMYRVYGWMCVGLSLTASVAYNIAKTPALMTAIYSNWWIVLLLVFSQFALIIALSVFLVRLSFATAAFLFVLYSLLVGATLSSIFLVFTLGSIFTTFFVAAGMFGAMSLYGYFTGADLSKLRSFLFMALFGLIIALIVNMFIQSSRFDTILSFFGVGIFILLIAYDTQKIKQIAQRLIADHQSIDKVALFGALTLYLDFLNLFLFLLQISGQRRSD